ncbi:hypothetical protein [Methylobacterium sp. E-045]|uniref:hypothetical protein n=1 Tax=Methylobacterium sp. E-045 TaxID=2836575 RepID=UPI001FBBBB02|nr:hypothetical protein [Methylobacterium sp. E-045]MCJ2131325.1 hypothetical protein [Methylobacterium sp. E-045]
MPRYLFFLTCIVIFLPSWAGIVMVVLPVITGRSEALAIEGEILLIGAMAVLLSTGTTAMLFSAHPFRRTRR